MIRRAVLAATAASVVTSIAMCYLLRQDYQKAAERINTYTNGATCDTFTANVVDILMNAPVDPVTGRSDEYLAAVRKGAIHSVALSDIESELLQEVSERTVEWRRSTQKVSRISMTVLGHNLCMTKMEEDK